MCSVEVKFEEDMKKPILFRRGELEGYMQRYQELCERQTSLPFPTMVLRAMRVLIRLPGRKIYLALKVTGAGCQSPLDLPGGPGD